MNPTINVSVGRKGISFDLSVKGDSISFDMDVSGGTGSRLPEYKGDYEVVPQVVSQTLPTKNRTLVNDVLVKEIPTKETHNDYGTTFTIG